MPDFYRFQIREKRREEIIDHRKRNAKDLDTVKQMKKARKDRRGYVQERCPPSIQRDDVFWIDLPQYVHILSHTFTIVLRVTGRMSKINQHRE